MFALQSQKGSGAGFLLRCAFWITPLFFWDTYRSQKSAGEKKEGVDPDAEMTYLAVAAFEQKYTFVQNKTTIFGWNSTLMINHQFLKAFLCKFYFQEFSFFTQFPVAATVHF